MREIQDQFIMDPLEDANIMSFQEIWRDIKREGHAQDSAWKRKLDNMSRNQRHLPEYDDPKDKPQTPPSTPIIREDSYALATREEQEEMRKGFGKWKDRVMTLGHIRAAIVHGISRIKRIANAREMEDDLNPEILNTPVFPFLSIPDYINPLLLAHEACYLEYAAWCFRLQDSVEAAECMQTTVRMQFEDGICIRRMLASGFLEAFTLQETIPTGPKDFR
jgi:hypothetical protein